MDFKQIQELIKMINKSNIGEVSIEEKGFKLTIKQKGGACPAIDTLLPCRLSRSLPWRRLRQLLKPASVAASEKSSKAAEAPARQYRHHKESHDRDLLS